MEIILSLVMFAMLSPWMSRRMTVNPIIPNPDLTDGKTKYFPNSAIVIGETSLLIETK